MGGEAACTGVAGDDGHSLMMVEAIRERGVDVSRVRQMRGGTAIAHVELVGGEEGVPTDFALTPEDITCLGAQPIGASALWGQSHPYFGEIRARFLPKVCRNCGGSTRGISRLHLPSHPMKIRRYYRQFDY